MVASQSKGKKGAAGGLKKKAVSCSVKGSIPFPVGRIRRCLKKGRYSQRVGIGASIYMAAVLEYLAFEELKLPSDAARDHKKNIITPRHLVLAVRSDEDLGKLLSGVTFVHGGVLPNINHVLVPKTKPKKADNEPMSPSKTVKFPNKP